ncbi:MAG: hypothetical protein U0350_35920 [Caldilineaceae bacterium]
MQVVLEAVNLPSEGAVTLDMRREFTIEITAEAAQRKVNRWLWDEVSMLISADPPTLVIGDQVVWRMPVYFSAPSAGRVGAVGAVDVDIQTGKLVDIVKAKMAIEHCATKLAAGLPPFKPLKVASKYIPKDIPPAPKLILPEE